MATPSRWWFATQREHTGLRPERQYAVVREGRVGVGGVRHVRNPGEVAIAWVLSNPAVTGAIVGARNAKQAEGVMRAGELKLPPEEIVEIEGAAAAAVAR